MQQLLARICQNECIRKASFCWHAILIFPDASDMGQSVSVVDVRSSDIARLRLY